MTGDDSEKLNIKDPSKPETLDNLVDVLEHLSAAGWKITKTTLYRHQKEGRILPQADGLYSIAAVNKYAGIHLKKVATGKKVNEELDAILKKKADQELKYQELKHEREQFNFDKDKGLYIRRDQVDIGLAARAGVLCAGLKHWVQSKTADWITAVGGDTKKTGELINIITRDVDEHINHYASSKEYEVVIDAAEENELREVE